MTITNGYCSLAELKERLMDMWTYSASTIAFNGTAKTITDTAYGLSRFEQSDNIVSLIKITGGTNAGVYTVTNVTPSAITVSETLTTAAAGTAITIQKWGMDFADPIMEQVINTCSRAIDKYCRRQFFTEVQTRYYKASVYDAVAVNDFSTMAGTGAGVKIDIDGDGTFETTLSASDYVLWPYNAYVDGEPFTEIHIADNGNHYFPVNVEKGVQITGTWGYSATAPEPVKEACLILAARLYKRKDAPFGVTGPNQFGEMTIIDKFDSDVRMLLAPYVRHV